MCEEYIVDGRVRVNGRVVTELGTRIDPTSDLVDVDGTAIQLDATKRYIMLSKPTGVVSSMKDEQGRPAPPPLHAGVARAALQRGPGLDAETSGLLVLTNDGDLAHVLAHPSGSRRSTSRRCRGSVTPQTIATLTRGIELDDGPIAADKARLLDSSGTGSAARASRPTMHSGRNRIVRRMMTAVGHPVIDLVRRQFGPLHLGALPAGQARELTTVGRGALLTAARQAAPTPPGDS